MKVRMLNAPQCPNCKRKDVVVRLGAREARGTSGYYCGRCKTVFEIPALVLKPKT